MQRALIVVFALFLAVPAARADSTYRYEDVGRVVAVADVHGAYQELVAVLLETAVIDESLRWRAGRTHLVSLGDLVDRGPDSRKVLDLLMRLEHEARTAGGAVHVVLGNHELMNIAGDLRYVSESEYAAFAGADDDALREAAWRRVLERDPDALRAGFDEAHPAGWFAHREAFSTSGHYGGWLSKRPFLIVIDDVAFAHGGLPALVARLGLEETNRTLHSQLAAYLRSWQAIDSALAPARPIDFMERPAAVSGQVTEDQAGSLLAMQHTEVFTSDGPTWFRGQALCNPYAEAENLDAAFRALGVSRLVVGHTVSPTGRALSRFDGRVILLDAGMLKPVYRGSPAALVIEDGRSSIAYADLPGQRLQPEVRARAVGPRPAGLPDDVLEHWLREAEVVSIEELDAGITQPQRVTLQKDGIELRAVFKRLSTDFGSMARRQSLDNADRFEYELAAYRLDRLLGLDMVPVTVPRTINGRRGILQFWVDDSMNLRTMLERKLEPEGWCEAGPQYNLMNVFDVLIHNTDRTQENALFTRDWTLVLIDHSRAFPTYQKRPRLLYQGELTLPSALAERLATLDRETLQQALGAWLQRRQIDALLKRRDQLLREHRSRTGAGERAAGG
ncbi:MAG TPA: metallophosphoesterase [Steroidobacteraceae bacterium]|nr:metallophosphoesterase [Steroidobacteraceae bacterium]